MDFSLNVDPSLRTTLSSPSSSSSLDYLVQSDFEIFSDGQLSPVIPHSMVYQTIEPSQLTEYSASPSPYSSPSASPNYILDSSSSRSSSSSPSPQPRRNSRKLHVKRHQTKLACSWCRKLSKKCDAQRPCGRCVQFNRCSECVDAPPRKPRAKGVDRGTYKKTRDLATQDYQEAINRREAYVAKAKKLGRTVKVGLTADEILQQTRKDEARMEKESQKNKNKVLLPPCMGDISATTLQGGSLPFTGPLEDLFTCSASPEIGELVFSSPPSSPANSLFDEPSSSPTGSATDHDESDDLTTWHWQTMEMFPNVMELVAAAQANETARSFDLEELQRWSELALVA
jgi:Fungal Zn(2)-Cys(6) binuclear cluster domain